jgi:hypothetical protein
MAKTRIRLFNQFRAGRKDASAEAATIAKDRTQLFNQLTLLFLALAPIVLICYLLIYLYPTSPINPFRPIAPETALVPPSTWTPAPTRTPTATRRPTNTPVNTHTPTQTPTATETAAPTAATSGTRKGTPLPTSTPTKPRPTEPGGTPQPTQSPFNYVFDLNYQRSQLYGVNWAGVAGLVIGLNGERQSNIDVHVWGDPPLGPDGELIASGTAPQYGASGWEKMLADKPAFGKWYVQLINSDGSALSPVVEIKMEGDPLANLAYVIFTQNH